MYYEDYNNTDSSFNVYSQPSNELSVSPDVSLLVDAEEYAFTYASASKAEYYWQVAKRYYKYFDGFKIYASINGAEYKMIKNVAVGSYSSKETYYYEYKVSLKAPSSVGYSVRFRISPYYNYDSKTYQFNPTKYSTAYYTSPKFATITTKKDKVVIKIKKAGTSKVKVVYRAYNMSKHKYSKKKTKTTSKTSFTIKNNAKKYSLDIDIIPYWGKSAGDVLEYNSHDANILLKCTPKVKGYKTYNINVQGKKLKKGRTETLSAKDKKIIKDFFDKKYGKNKPSREEMAKYAFDWIHNNVKYAYEIHPKTKKKLYAKIDNLSYVDAIFNKKLGQCLQYNGAMAKVLTYLGYEARIVQGYRKSSYTGEIFQHFWCEVKIYGRWYLMETGNKDKNGSWQHFVELYGDGAGYLKCKKKAKD